MGKYESVIKRPVNRRSLLKSGMLAGGAAAAIKLSSITRMLIWLLRKLGHSFLTRAVEAKSPIDMLNQTEVRVHMTQSYPQFVSEPLAARHAHAGNLAATKRSSQQADDLKRRTTAQIRTAFAIAVGFAGLMAGFPRASAQMIVPVDRTLHPPQGFDFSGEWNCGDGASTAHLEVENRNRSTGGALLRLPGPWTEIHESQDGFKGNYFVGYDRDKSQFLMIDADDPASVAYSTEGWNGKKLLLTSTNDKGQLGLPLRIQYDVDDSRRFTVTWETLEGAAWKAEPGFKCIKVDGRRSITRLKSRQVRDPH
jgi:hypothetical protein